MNVLYYVFIMPYQRDLQLQGHGAEEQDCKWDMKNKKCAIPFGNVLFSLNKKNIIR